MIKKRFQMNLFWGLCIVFGCSDRRETTSPAVVAVDNTALDRSVVPDAEIELKTLKAGAALVIDRSELVQDRIDYLTTLIRDPSKGSWSDDNSNRESCLVLEAQLTALAMGRGLVGSEEQVEGRMKRLQSLLKKAGYAFDESGNEQKWDESGNRRNDYTPLLKE